MKKVYIIKGKDEQELADNINKFDKEIFATQPLQKKNGEFIAFVYCNEEGMTNSKNYEKSSPQGFKSSNNDSSKPTEKQMYVLGQIPGIKDIDKLTKSEAIEIIREYREKQENQVAY